MGDARGHMSRSLAVAQTLAHHEFLFVGGGVVRELKQLGYLVEDLPMASTFFRDNRVDFPSTIANAVRVLAGRSSTIARLAAIIRSFDPDLIVTDYELFTPLAAHKLGRQCISLDHQHVLTHCVYDVPPQEKLNRFLTCFSVRHLYSAADRFLIISFFPLPPADPSRTEVWPPVLRRAVKDHQASQGDHALVYLSVNTFETLLPVLQSIDRKFLVYGFGDRPAASNLTFKPPSVDGFLEDMASARYVVTTGGHSTISEALYFGKPVLCYPIESAYEQFLNAHFLSKWGFGEHASGIRTTRSVLEHFEVRLGEYASRIQGHDFFGNHRVAGRLEEIMGRGGK